MNSLIRKCERADLAQALGWKMFPYIVPGEPDDHQMWCPPGAEIHISNAVSLPPMRELVSAVAALLTRLADAEREREECPDCKGSGKTNWIPVHVQRPEGEGPLTPIEAAMLADDINQCRFCNAIGKVTDQQLAWRLIGAAWKDARLTMQVGLREWSEKVGARPSEYCNMEHGYIKPDEKFSPLKSLSLGRCRVAAERQAKLDALESQLTALTSVLDKARGENLALIRWKNSGMKEPFPNAETTSGIALVDEVMALRSELTALRTQRDEAIAERDKLLAQRAENLE